MKNSLKAGLGFGLSSGIITTLGLIVGLYSSTNSITVILGGIFTIAFADALSDAIGMHISRESEEEYSGKEVWEATISTFFSKLIFALTFVIPFLFLKIKLAILSSFLWGIILLAIYSYYLAKQQKIKTYKVIIEHLSLAIVVVVCTYFIGKFVALVF